ncbi:MAG: class I SAM-dependent methyltransferase [archaeon]|nr:class I SAM-dependent methyltransferase [archaeon]
MLFDNLDWVPEVTDPRFSMKDDGGVEQETGELIYGFVRRLKPTNCLSTGVYTGISDLFIAQALKDNGLGHLTALEYEQVHIDRARKLWEEVGVSQQITTVKTDSLQFKPMRNYQFMFLDTELNLRFKELVNFFPNLDEGGYIFVHDMPRSLCQGNVNPDHPDFKNWPVGELPPEFIELVKSGKLKSFYFAGARGLVGFYKSHGEDFI